MTVETTEIGEPTAAAFAAALEAHRSDDQLETYQQPFRFDADDQPDDDYFIGVRMGRVFDLAKEYVELPLEEIEVLLESPIHEALLPFLDEEHHER